MSKTIQAVFENGVFKPLQEIEMKEHEKVELRIFSKDEWQERFDRIIARLHKAASKYPAIRNLCNAQIEVNRHIASYGGSHERLERC